MNTEFSRQAWRFLLAGGMNTLLSLAIYQLLLFWLPYAVSFTLAFAAGILFTGVVYARYVFEVRPTGRRFARNAVFYAVSYGLSLALLSALIDGMGLHERLAVVVAIGFMVPVNFFCLRWLLTL